jgi:hypothetical protein
MAASNLITHTCQSCGNEFHRKPDKAKLRKYCSPKCLYNARRKVVQVARFCRICATPITAPQTKSRPRNYCSCVCSALGKRRHFEQSCEECKTMFTPDKDGRRFCSVECRDKHWSGGNHPNWQTGRSIRKDGYVMIKLPDHPRARSDGYVLEHIVVAEGAIGRSLRIDEVVHHLDHNRQNNEPSNLKVMTHSEHSSLHSNEYWHGGRTA